jgi:hypothetical protein
MSTTVGAIIRSSLRKLGVLASGEPLSASDGQDSLEVLGQMIDGWSGEPLMIPVSTSVKFTLLDGVTKYTIGRYAGAAPANHIETARPEQIVSAFIRDQGNTDYSLKTLSEEALASLSTKDNPSIPSRYILRQGWPLSEIEFNTAPYQPLELNMILVQPLNAILPTANLTDAIDLPPGYERALVFNLCVDLADEWGKEVSAATASNASYSKTLLKRKNSREITITTDKMLPTINSGRGTYLINEGP